MSEQPHEQPTFRQLLQANLKVVLALAAVALFAYLVWLGLRQLFPDVAWLNPAQNDPSSGK